jgi:FAD/FMN-containing dehydrogenase
VVREHQLLFTVRSGGHDYAGNSTCEDGLVIDLSKMNEVRVDAEAGRATVRPGARWGEVTEKAQEHGLAPAGGTVSTVGVAGFTLGGGTGYLTRKHGLAVDNLISAKVVTADGEQVTASEQENPDLFWALRGGSGNFGIVTSFEIALHPVGPEVLAGQIIFPFEEAAGVLASWREFMPTAPNELDCLPVFYRVPPLPDFPEELHGQVVLALLAVYIGAVEEGQKATAPLRAMGTPLMEILAPMPYNDVQTMLDDGAPAGQRWYTRSHFLKALPNQVIGAVLDHVKDLPGVFSLTYFWAGGGAVSGDPTRTAYPHREAPFGIHVWPGWTDPDQDNAVMAWAQSLHQALEPHSTSGVYVNLLGSDEEERVPAAYGVNYRRLAEIKRKYDPENLFRHNHNIEPAA